MFGTATELGGVMMYEQRDLDTTHKLDLRKVPPDERNRRVLQAMESIRPGTIFLLYDNGEPEEIHEQLNRDFKGRFRWKLLHDGPDLWVVKIAKLNGFHFELR